MRIVFDPNCEGCFDESGTRVCFAIWNNGKTAEDVQVYVSCVTPGPTLGKLQLAWLGEGRTGRSINKTIQSGHLHVFFLASSGNEPYMLQVASPIGALPDTEAYVAEVLVEGRNIPPMVAKVEIDPRKEPPIRGISPLSA